MPSRWASWSRAWLLASLHPVPNLGHDVRQCREAHEHLTVVVRPLPCLRRLDSHDEAPVRPDPNRRCRSKAAPPASTAWRTPSTTRRSGAMSSRMAPVSRTRPKDQRPMAQAPTMPASESIHSQPKARASSNPTMTSTGIAASARTWMTATRTLLSRGAVPCASWRRACSSNTTGYARPPACTRAVDSCSSGTRSGLANRQLYRAPTDGLPSIELPAVERQRRLSRGSIPLLAQALRTLQPCRRRPDLHHPLPGGSLCVAQAELSPAGPRQLRLAQPLRPDLQAVMRMILIRLASANHSHVREDHATAEAASSHERRP